VRPFPRFRGPRLGTKILLLGLLLLVVPWFSYRQLLEMERLLIQGQSTAQLLTAEGISTLFNGRDDLFEDLPIAAEEFENLYVHALENPIRLDGRADDWGLDPEEQSLRFGSAGGDQDGDFRLLLGERRGQLYAWLEIVDRSRVYRSPDHLRLDSADQLRITYIRPDGEDGRLEIVFTGPGALTSYPVDSAWRYAVSSADAPTVQGTMVETPDGLRVEFRLPMRDIGSARYFGLAYADVDDPVSREIRQVTQTLPAAGKESFNLVVLRSPEVVNIIQGLGYAGARILVIDPQMRVRAATGSNPGMPGDEPAWTPLERLSRWLASVSPGLHEFLGADDPALRPGIAEDPEATAANVIASSLQGEPIALRRRLADGQEVIMAAHPIVSRDQVIGTVVVEQNTSDILAFQRAALEQIMWVSLLSFFGVLIALLAFAARLAWRIRKLRKDANGAIDSYGRLRTGTLRRELTSGDELGDLARSVSNMLSRLQQHNVFLESMPRTLRHEINNPLNVVSTSLQNLAAEHPDLHDSKYLESARRGVLRIGSIVQNLADAANLEDSLAAEELERVDVRELLENYVANCARTHAGTSFRFSGPDRPVYAMVSDYRVEQLLDKIIDNAVDFHRSNTPITVDLTTYRDFLQIAVANRGPLLPTRSDSTLFDSMVSHRAPENRLHFGLGLYVVRIIAEHHGGFARAVNLADDSGVVIFVQLPLASPEPGSVDPATADSVTTPATQVRESSNGSP
jgi:two-component system sensor histidine kinase ChvG